MNIRLSKITLLVLSVYLLAGCAEKYELDRKMEELCKKDGGAKIYETVKLSPEFFEANGLIKNKEYSREGNKTYLKMATDFILINEIIYIKEGDPLKGQGMLLRSKSELRRISDNSLLAEEVKYGRSGGDIWFFNLPTQASCPTKPIDIVNEVFKK